MKVYQKVWIPDHEKNVLRERPFKDEEFIVRGPVMVAKADHDAEVERLREYVEHKRTCLAWPYRRVIDGYAPGECTCGLVPDSDAGAQP